MAGFFTLLVVGLLATAAAAAVAVTAAPAPPSLVYAAGTRLERLDLGAGPLKAHTLARHLFSSLTRVVTAAGSPDTVYAVNMGSEGTQIVRIDLRAPYDQARAVVLAVDADGGSVRTLSLSADDDRLYIAWNAAIYALDDVKAASAAAAAAATSPPSIKDLRLVYTPARPVQSIAVYAVSGPTSAAAAAGTDSEVVWLYSSDGLQAVWPNPANATLTKIVTIDGTAQSGYRCVSAVRTDGAGLLSLVYTGQDAHIYRLDGATNAYDPHHLPKGVDISNGCGFTQFTGSCLGLSAFSSAAPSSASAVAVVLGVAYGAGMYAGRAEAGKDLPAVTCPGNPKDKMACLDLIDFNAMAPYKPGDATPVSFLVTYSSNSSPRTNRVVVVSATAPTAAAISTLSSTTVYTPTFSPPSTTAISVNRVDLSSVVYVPDFDVGGGISISLGTSLSALHLPVKSVTSVPRAISGTANTDVFVSLGSDDRACFSVAMTAGKLLSYPTASLFPKAAAAAAPAPSSSAVVYTLFDQTQALPSDRCTHVGADSVLHWDPKTDEAVWRKDDNVWWRSATGQCSAIDYKRSALGEPYKSLIYDPVRRCLYRASTIDQTFFSVDSLALFQVPPPTSWQSLVLPVGITNYAIYVGPLMGDWEHGTLYVQQTVPGTLHSASQTYLTGFGLVGDARGKQTMAPVLLPASYATFRFTNIEIESATPAATKTTVPGLAILLSQGPVARTTGNVYITPLSDIVNMTSAQVLDTGFYNDVQSSRTHPTEAGCVYMVSGPRMYRQSVHADGTTGVAIPILSLAVLAADLNGPFTRSRSGGRLSEAKDTSIYDFWFNTAGDRLYIARRDSELVSYAWPLVSADPFAFVHEAHVTKHGKFTGAPTQMVDHGDIKVLLLIDQYYGNNLLFAHALDTATGRLAAGGPTLLQNPCRYIVGSVSGAVYQASKQRVIMFGGYGTDFVGIPFPAPNAGPINVTALALERAVKVTEQNAFSSACGSAQFIEQTNVMYTQSCPNGLDRTSFWRLDFSGDLASGALLTFDVDSRQMTISSIAVAVVKSASTAASPYAPFILYTANSVLTQTPIFVADGDSSKAKLGDTTIVLCYFPAGSIGPFTTAAMFDADHSLLMSPNQCGEGGALNVMRFAVNPLKTPLAATNHVIAVTGHLRVEVTMPANLVHVPPFVSNNQQAQYGVVPTFTPLVASTTAAGADDVEFVVFHQWVFNGLQGRGWPRDVMRAAFKLSDVKAAAAQSASASPPSLVVEAHTVMQDICLTGQDNTVADAPVYPYKPVVAIDGPDSGRVAWLCGFRFVIHPLMAATDDTLFDTRYLPSNFTWTSMFTYFETIYDYDVCMTADDEGDASSSSSWFAPFVVSKPRAYTEHPRAAWLWTSSSSASPSSSTAPSNTVRELVMPRAPRPANSTATEAAPLLYPRRVAVDCATRTMYFRACTPSGAKDDTPPTADECFIVHHDGTEGKVIGDGPLGGSDESAFLTVVRQLEAGSSCPTKFKGAPTPLPTPTPTPPTPPTPTPPTPPTPTPPHGKHDEHPGSGKHGASFYILIGVGSLAGVLVAIVVVRRLRARGPAYQLGFRGLDDEQDYYAGV